MSRSSSPESGVRLNKFLASCGLGSRRKCEELIREGRIEINGKVVLDLSTKVQPDDYVRFDGRVVRAEKEITILLNKPKGYLCTADDPEGRKTIYDLLPGKFRSLAYVGRLDLESHGLLLLTNSGELNETLTHPRHEVEKEYVVTINRAFEPEHTDRMLEGIRLAEGLAKADSMHFFTRKRIGIVLSQGYNRQIRRMFAKLDYKVRELERVRIGSFTAADLSTGDHRVLNAKEIEAVCRNPKGAKKTKITSDRPTGDRPPRKKVARKKPSRDDWSSFAPRKKGKPSRRPSSGGGTSRRKPPRGGSSR
ncbi:MAG: rRNA pseudouridine synthase [Verrucomicrobiae bacterium]|nr:rRNA pseudouridine synthase [Verrucomicrobiae bacterium]